MINDIHFAILLFFPPQPYCISIFLPHLQKSDRMSSKKDDPRCKTTKFWTTDPTKALEQQKVAGTEGSWEALTVIEVFQKTVSRHRNEPAMRLKRRPTPAHPIPHDWQTWTWQQYWGECRDFAKSLIHLKVDVYKIVNILGFNSPEWFVANVGAIMGSCIAAGIYSTNLGEACHYISNHSEAEVIACDTNKQLKKYADFLSDPNAKTSEGTPMTLPYLKAMIVWEEAVDPKIKATIEKSTKVKVYSWSEFMALGKSVDDAEIEKRLAFIKAGNCSTLIYTSGTTGPPKAVMISHDNITWTTKSMVDGNYMDLGHTDRVVSYLPLSHIAAQIIDLHVPINTGACTYFCQPDAMKGTLTVTMKDARPTIFFGVPRVWEKIQEKMVDIGRKNSALLQTISKIAKSVGTNKTKLSQFGAEPSICGNPCGYACANTIVFKKVRSALGLDDCKACFTAAAPIAPEVLWYFGSLNIPVYEVFGQSECTGPHTVSAPTQWKIGYCGRPLRGTESMIAPVTQELCYRGRHIMMGYMYGPKETAETIDDKGYLHSGDVSEFDEHTQEGMQGPSGFMKITGRIKELIITAGGENIPPVLIENEMKAAMDAVSNCMVVGDKRKFLGMLITLKTTVDSDGVPTNILAPSSLAAGAVIGSTAKTTEEAAACPLWKKYFDDGTKKANSKTTSNAQIVQKWKLVLTDFSEKGGELTPTQKLKRKVAATKYDDLIESIYADASTD